jgi:hypothetical protein
VYACRVRGFVTLSGVTCTVAGHEDRLRRVSTRDQNPDAQRDALAAAGCDQVFIDKASGDLARRPELNKALLVARAGAQLVVTKLDLLGRSLEASLTCPGASRRRGRSRVCTTIVSPAPAAQPEPTAARQPGPQAARARPPALVGDHTGLV